MIAHAKLFVNSYKDIKVDLRVRQKKMINICAIVLRRWANHIQTT